ncbi:glycosyl hydrolase 115 family protein [Amphiplicatus metriothermophilus]|uniref:Glycosyl hydrolase family 115 n=1 Tax=Amphiplicatus metriothermophilus TaxID=1519374 RepID=A0A239PX61_9PROT|nr:glycosyl hydrolase 115 family protein [Amphiplicatus metriothermophilus]MBB5518994.1 hypothetical protein [Amphiplicatus metriothermophilus]SNT74613.1 Glycosyl hydrolase family 115 [Amphiplicatus metriothermophilus]
MAFLTAPRPATALRAAVAAHGRPNLDNAIIGAFVLALAAAVLVCSPTPAAAGTAPGAIAAEPVANGFALIRNGRPAPIVVDDEDDAGVLIAARNLRKDLAAVGGRTGVLVLSGAAPTGERIVVVGTLGRSRLIDDLVARSRLDPSSIAGAWEAFAQIVVEAPWPGVKQALVIAGADRRGTIFGVYDLARRAGISPWTWWADVPVKRARNLHVAPGLRAERPAVRYRGIFLNDEEPALGGWARETFGGFNHAFYEKVFELILRLKGNYLWPAMWGKAFYDDDPMNAVLADRMGIVIGTSHHEPMGRAHAEWARYGEGPWDYAKNAEVLREFWREGVERLAGREAIVTIGMRGDGDEPMSEETAIGLLERIVADQRRIIEEATGAPAAQTPQVWALYKEVQDYYDQGMEVPDDVTLLFADDNWGNIRRLPAPGATRAGGYGVYYHFDYVGGPRSYKWLSTNQIERVWEQMNLAWEYGARELWIVNVGDLKPMEFPTSFFLDYAWSPEKWPLARLADYPKAWAAAQFGDAHAAEIADLLTTHAKYNARRKPELLSPETYSLVNYAEADRIVADYEALAARADALRQKLPERYDDAYVQLVWFPIHASANLNALYVAAAKNHLCADQGRSCASEWATKTQALFERDAELTRIYHEDVAGGKWRHMMSQTHIGYTYWQQPDHNTMPAVRRVSGPIGPAFSVAFDRRRQALAPGGKAFDAPLIFDRNSPAAPPVATVYSRIDGEIRFEVDAPAWLRVEPRAGVLDGEQDVRLAVDWTAAPEGDAPAVVAITAKPASGGPRERVEFPVLARNRTPDAPAGAFIEADGYVSFEAAHYARAIDGDGVKWKTIPNLGRTGDGVSAFPRAGGAVALAEDSPRLEFDFYAFTAGEVAVDVVLAPTLDFKAAGGLRYAVSIDDQTPVIVNVHEDGSEQAWSRSVADNAHLRASRHVISSPGAHTLKLWLIDPALVFQKVTIHTEGAAPSYLGPPESLRVP